MTIYAIVDNLISSAKESPEGDSLWSVISASAILQGGNPYFVPDFAERFEARGALALRIGKLGKSISPRFAHRYVDAIAPATLMVAKDMLEKLRKSGLPWSKAISYDRSVAIGSFRHVDFNAIAETKAEMLHQSEGETTCIDIATEETTGHLEKIISDISRDNALKTGDIILTGVKESGPTMHPGERMILKLGGEEVLKFNIR